MLTLIVIGFVAGCQSHKNPTTPTNEITQTQNLPDTKPASSKLWGYYNMVADLESETIEALPNRISQAHINATQPLNNSLGLSVHIDPSSNFQQGYVVVNVGITHPFPNNPNLTGFDTRGILLTTGSLEANGLKLAGPGDPDLLNADGWTRWWNPSEFTTPGLFGYTPGNLHIYPPGVSLDANINPYKIFADGLLESTSPDLLAVLPLTDTNGRAIFRAGSTNHRFYTIQFPVNGTPKIYFDYAIDASWSQPAVKPPVNLPGDFPIYANMPEAFLMKPSVISNTLQGIPGGGGTGAGELVLKVEIFDWQAWANFKYTDQVPYVNLYSPYIDFDNPSLSKELTSNSIKITATAQGTTHNAGKIPVLIEVPALDASYKQGPQAAPDGNVAAYYLLDINVASLDCTADENVICDDAVSIDTKATISSAVCAPYDPSDWYSFVVPSGVIMSGTITLENNNQYDTDLYIYDGCPGTALYSKLTLGKVDEVLAIDNIEPGIYYASVIPGESADGEYQIYTLKMNLGFEGENCTADSNNEYTSAAFIGLLNDASDSVCAGGDLRDWYMLTVPSGKVAGGTIYLDNQSTGDINIRIYDEYPGAITWWGYNTGSQDELVNIPGLGPGNHYVEIYAQGSAPDDDRMYTISTNLSMQDFTCGSDDTNDSYLVADDIGLNAQASGTVCFPGDIDWYTFNVAEGTSVDGTITLSGNLTYDNDMYLYLDPQGAPIATATTPGINDESIDTGKLAEGKYYIKVTAHPAVGSGVQNYTLNTDFETSNVGDFTFQIHAHIITANDGSSPATTEARVHNDIAWANEFWGKWGGSIELTEIDYINRTSWLAASTSEMQSCHQQYRDTSGPINVYYVNNVTDLESAAAYAIMACRYNQQNHNMTYIVNTDYGTGRTLAHELGHAFSLLFDEYLLDFYTCAQIKSGSCAPGTIDAWCSPSDAIPGNIMYWHYTNLTQPTQYFMSQKNWQTPEKPIDSQVENWVYFHTNYKNNF